MIFLLRLMDSLLLAVLHAMDAFKQKDHPCAVLPSSIECWENRTAGVY